MGDGRRPAGGSVVQTTQDEKYFCSDKHEIGLVPWPLPRFSSTPVPSFCLHEQAIALLNKYSIYWMDIKD